MALQLRNKYRAFKPTTQALARTADVAGTKPCLQSGCCQPSYSNMSYSHTNYSQTSRGFTLIELMIVVAIIAILSSIAIPAYQDFTTRAKLSEAFAVALPAKAIVAEKYTSSGIAPLADAANSYNAENYRSKYVASININPANGEITITSTNSNTLVTGARGQTMVLTPQVRVAGNYELLSTLPNGLIDWSCSSATSVTSTARGMQVVTAGTMPGRFVSYECR